MTAAHERLKQQPGRAASGHFQLESLLSSSAFSFVDGVVRLVSDEVGSHCAKLTGVAASALESLELDFWSIVELFRVAERENEVSTTNYESSRTSFSRLLSLKTIGLHDYE